MNLLVKTLVMIGSSTSILTPVAVGNSSLKKNTPQRGLGKGFNILKSGREKRKISRISAFTGLCV